MKIKILLLIPLVIFSCKLKTDQTLSGDKNIVTAIIDVKPFDAISLDINKYDYYINSLNTASIKIINSETDRVVINTDQNILQNLSIRNSFNCLYITSNNVYEELAFSTLNIEIYTKDIQNISNNLTSSKVQIIGFDKLKSLFYNTLSPSELILPEAITITDQFSISSFNYMDSIITVSGLKQLFTGNLENIEGSQLYFPDIEKIVADNNINITLNMKDQQDNLSLFGENIYITSIPNNLSINQIKANKYIQLKGGILKVDKIVAPLLNVTNPYTCAIESIESSEVSFISSSKGTSTEPILTIGNIKTDNLILKLAEYISLPVLENIKLLDIIQSSSSLTLKGNVNTIKLNIASTDFYSESLITEFNGTYLTCNNAKITQENNSVVKLNIKDELTYNLKGNSKLIYSGVRVPTVASTKDETATITYLGEIK